MCVCVCVCVCAKCVCVCVCDHLPSSSTKLAHSQRWAAMQSWRSLRVKRLDGTGPVYLRWVDWVGSWLFVTGWLTSTPVGQGTYSVTRHRYNSELTFQTTVSPKVLYEQFRNSDGLMRSPGTAGRYRGWGDRRAPSHHQTHGHIWTSCWCPPSSQSPRWRRNAEEAGPSLCCCMHDCMKWRKLLL